MEFKLKESLTLHPFLFALFPIFFIYSINSQEIKFEEIFSLFIIILPITFGLIFILSLIFQNKKAIGFVISIGFINPSPFRHEPSMSSQVKTPLFDKTVNYSYRA